MNVCIDFLNSLPRHLTFKFTATARSYVHNSYFVIYPVKMADTTFEYRFYKQCVQKITTAQKSMNYPSYVVQRM